MYRERVDAERLILKCVNSGIPDASQHLSGLSEPTIQRWQRDVGVRLFGARAAAVTRRLVAASRLLRLGSSASHRAALVHPIPSRELLTATLREIDVFFCSKRDGATSH
jgi:hypothetical protein